MLMMSLLCGNLRTKQERESEFSDHPLRQEGNGCGEEAQSKGEGREGRKKWYLRVSEGTENVVKKKVPIQI